MKRMEVKLIWVPSHSGIRKNEQANTVWYGYTIWNPDIEVY